MKKNIQLLVWMIVLFVIIISPTVFASEKDSNVEYENVYGEIVIADLNTSNNVSPYKLFENPKSLEFSPYGTSKPSGSNVWNWNNGNCNVSGNSTNTNLYTNYVFTNATSLRLYITKNNVDLTFQIYQYNAILPDKHIATGTIADIKADELGKVTRIATVSNLDTSKKYYVIFIAPAYFAGYIGKV